MGSTDHWDSTASLLAATSVPAGRDAMWATALAFLNAGDRDDAHLVASVLVVEADGRVLLARHRRYGQWGPVGGHVESGDASLSDAAARELTEESALVARVHPAPIDVHLSTYRCRTTTEPVLHLDVLFAAIVAGPTPDLVANEELADLEWFDPNVLPFPLTPDAAELITFAAATLQR